MTAQDYTPDPNLKVWLDGKLVPVADANINVFSHGLLYGDGVFEGIRVYHSRIFECTAHMDRFVDSLKAIRMEIPWTRQQIVDAIEQTRQANKIENGYVRLVATRGVGTLGIHPFRTASPSVFVIVATIQMYDPEMYEKGMRIVTASTIRNHPNAMAPRIKSLNYLNNIMAKLEAVDAGCLEAMMLNHEGYIAECTGDNLFLVRLGKLQTPAPHCGILEGITRRLILKFAEQRGIPTEETTLTRQDMYFAEEAFITGTGAEVCPVTEIDQRPIGNGTPGPITRQLIADFREHTKSGKEMFGPS
ncbi:MAG: branched-chain-amino-acid transaminase [Phycisphaerales bacterium]|nr:branched-chain-amino-acid transaminase [Phycisphaerales bacterium]